VSQRTQRVKFECCLEEIFLHSGLNFLKALAKRKRIKEFMRGWVIPLQIRLFYEVFSHED
jgi:hypothetical protein